MRRQHALFRFVKRYLAHERNAQPFQVFPATHRRVHHLHQEQHHHGQEQTNGQGHEHYAAFLRLGRCRTARRRIDDTRIVGREGLRQFVFLPLLQEEEVKGFFHLLLTFHRQQIFCLFRPGGNQVLRFLLVLLQEVYLHVQRAYQVVERQQNSLPHRTQRLVQILDQGVVGTTVGHQTVALQLQGIELGNLIFDAPAFHPRIDRQQLVRRYHVHQIIADIPRYVKLVAQHLYVAFRLGRLGHVHARRGLHVGQQVFALVRRYILINVAQFLLDNLQAFVYQQRCAGRNSVFLANPIVVIHGYQGIQHVFRPLGGHIADGKVDNRGFFIAQTHRKRSRITTRHAVKARLGHHDGEGVFPPVIPRGLHYHRPHGRCHRVAQARRASRLAGQFLAACRESRQFDPAVGQQADGKPGLRIVAQTRKRHAHRQGIAIKHHLVQAAFHRIINVEVQPLHHILHEGGRLQGNDFVIHVRVRVEQAELRQGSRVRRYRLAARVILDQDGCRAGIYRRCAFDVQHRHTERHHQRDNKPIPLGQAQLYQVPYAHKVFCRLYLVCHSRQ